MQKTNRIGLGYSTNGKHYIMIKGKVIAHNCDSAIGEPILKTKGKIILKPNSISVIAVKTPKIPDTNILYEIDSKFQPPERKIPLRHITQSRPQNTQRIEHTYIKHKQ